MNKILSALLIAVSLNATADCLYTEKYVSATMTARQRGADMYRMQAHALLMRDSEQGLELLRAIHIAFDAPIDSDPDKLGHKSWLTCIKDEYRKNHKFD